MSEFAADLLMQRSREDLLHVDRWDQQDFAYALAQEADLAYAILPTEQIQPFTDFLVATGGGERFRHFLHRRLAGETVHSRDFEFLDEFGGSE